MLRSTVLALALVVTASTAYGQKPSCTVICTPAVSFGLYGIKSHLFNAPQVRSLKTNQVHTLASKTNTELQLFIDMPTSYKPLHLYASAQWLPTAKANTNPFTQYGAPDSVDDKIRANTPSLSLGAQLHLLPIKRTGGWVGSAVYVADLFSKAAQPDDKSDYTHKLDVGAYALLGIFNWVAPHAWLHHVQGVLTLDYVASGLPHAGDEVPKGQRVFLDSVHSPSLLFGVFMPLAPLNPK